MNRSSRVIVAYLLVADADRTVKMDEPTRLYIASADRDSVTVLHDNLQAGSIVIHCAFRATVSHLYVYDRARTM